MEDGELKFKELIKSSIEQFKHLTSVELEPDKIDILVDIIHGNVKQEIEKIK